MLFYLHLTHFVYKITQNALKSAHLAFSAVTCLLPVDLPVFLITGSHFKATLIMAAQRLPKVAEAVDRRARKQDSFYMREL